MRLVDEMEVRRSLRGMVESCRNAEAIAALCMRACTSPSDLKDMICGRKTLSERACRVAGFERVTRYVRRGES